MTDNILEEYRREHTFQPEDAPRPPKNKREEAAVARWIEIDKRRYETRLHGKIDERFRYTPAERQLKARLLKAGLIVVKDQPLTPRRKRIERNQNRLLEMAKHFADGGDQGAMEHLRNHAQNQRSAAWIKRQRMLRRLEPVELRDALRDVMEAKGLRRSLASLWREFTEAWETSSPERRATFVTQEHDRIAELPAVLEIQVAS